MTQNLNHYEKILSRSHSNYLAAISVLMNSANNQTNEVLSRMTALGTILMYVSSPPPPPRVCDRPTDSSAPYNLVR